MTANDDMPGKDPGWLARQFERAQEEIDNSPPWMYSTGRAEPVESELRLQWLSLSKNGSHISLNLPGLGRYLITREEAQDVYRWLGVQLNDQRRA